MDTDVIAITTAQDQDFDVRIVDQATGSNFTTDVIPTIVSGDTSIAGIVGRTGSTTGFTVKGTGKAGSTTLVCVFSGVTKPDGTKVDVHGICTVNVSAEFNLTAVFCTVGDPRPVTP